METNIYDLIIIGAGPAGTAGAVYASRKRLKTLLITGEFGGQSVVSSDIQNWIGTPSISGEALAKSFREHVKANEGDYLSVMDGKLVKEVKRSDGNFEIILEDGTSLFSHTVLITSGSKRRKLDIPGASEYENKGITYCATCDGPLFSDQDVVVVGGGNAAFETALQLLAYCKSVTLLNRSENFKADEITVEKALKNEKFRIIKNIELVKIEGETFVNKFVIKHKDSGEIEEIPATGIFVEIGQIPNTDFVKDILPLDTLGRIEIDPWNCKTEVEGIWAAGDVTNILYHQNNIAAGDAVKALEDLYIWVHKNKK